MSCARKYLFQRIFLGDKNAAKNSANSPRFICMSQTQETQVNSDGGNTKKLRLRSWFFTWNNPDISATQLTQLLAVADINKYAIQLEQGDSGTPHYQGVISYRNQITFQTLKALDSRIHWEPCHNLRAALGYCTKEQGRLDGPWTHNWTYEQPKNYLENPFPWQQECMDLIAAGQGDRKILWIADRGGGCGKTTLAKHLCSRGDALLVTGKAADIKCAVAGWLRRKRLGICIFHFTRTQEEFVSYQAIEEIKDGIFFSSKYESGMCIFEPPFVIVLANFDPDRSKLTGDRWDVRTIGWGDDGGGVRYGFLHHSL